MHRGPLAASKVWDGEGRAQERGRKGQKGELKEGKGRGKGGRREEGKKGRDGQQIFHPFMKHGCAPDLMTVNDAVLIQKFQKIDISLSPNRYLSSMMLTSKCNGKKQHILQPVGTHQM